MPIFQLTSEIAFPYQEYAQEDGLLAVGGDLSMERLLFAYENGIFPWFNHGEEILWWCPAPRCVIIPKEIAVSRTMKKIIKKNDLKVTFNKDFLGVMKNCRMLREDKEGTWISDDIIRAYQRLYECGYAMSVEVYKEDMLVGGLYGVVIGKCFFGESMFSKEPNSSKLALITLAKRLEQEEFLFIDCQIYSEHLKSMGARDISLEEFKNLLKVGCKDKEKNLVPFMFT